MTNCFARACTIVRRALGHRDHNACLSRLYFAEKGPVPADIPALLAEIFPDHKVIIVSPFRKALYKNCADNIQYVGKTVPDDVIEDEYLWLFSYTFPEVKEGKSHVVVGTPISHSPDMVIEEAIGVSIAPLAMLQKSRNVAALLEQQAFDWALSPIPSDDDEWWEVDEAYLEELQARMETHLEAGTIDVLPELGKKALIVEEEEEPEEPPWWEAQPKPSRIVMKMQRAPRWVDVQKVR